MENKSKTAEEYFLNDPNHQETLLVLRKLILASGLEETFKWSNPTYTWEGKNVMAIRGFKDHVGVWFFNGALMEDKGDVLVNAQEGKTQAMRQWKIDPHQNINIPLFQSYVEEAIENQKAGKVVPVQKKKPLVIPSELQTALDEDQDLKSAFGSLNLTKQREYTDYISEAKREQTKLNRLEKIRPMILEGKGLNDKYRK
ncbi:YdeI/OmpD-associated family protein [Sediminitomix flava]|uniref:Uncharacterized protein YdeI (YjbR/CyaY-like superfamily) n=1 Tax=Sediminitomix flava TaxID=379075 RepID=A0A315ZV40_SEDFL|nr:DUF1801 domain-containing protein [Sediminitomix flava]PWJ40049.1 uncharacterized protein YdeI (YjbR/CyaY-like superfamily) [Sediminitomix flava]